jgi:hypothetical protein
MFNSLDPVVLSVSSEGRHCRYMMGVAALTAEPNDLESARFHLDRAKEMLDELLAQYLAAGAPKEVNLNVS